MEREGKAKVVTSDWGAEFVQFLAALAVVSVYLEETVEFNLFFQKDPGKTARELDSAFMDLKKCCSF